MIASRSTTRSIVHTKYKYCTGKALAVASRARKLCQAAQQHQDNLISTNILEQCILAHFATDGLERTPEVVADAWGRAWTERLQELSDPVPLSFPDPYSNSHASCDVTLVGVFHRDAANLRVVRDAVSAAGGPDAVALEARPSFLPSYLHLAESLPEDLVMKMFDLPLHDLQAAFHYVDLEDRLAWHEVLLLTNEGLAHHQPGPPISTTPTISSGSSSSNSSSSSSSSSTSSSSSSTNISCKAQGSVAPFLAGAPSCPTTPSLSLSPSLSPTSALTAPKVVSAFLARELALSEKVAAALVAREYGIPLQGLELDDIEAYEGLLQGPLTDGQHRRTTALDSREPSTASTLQTASRGTDANGDGGGDGCRRNGSTKSRSSSAADGTVLSMPELEAEQWRMALDSLVPEVAAAFEEWLRSMAPDGEGSQQHQLLKRQLVGLMPQCMNPDSYMSYADSTDALWSDERRVGRALAEQHRRLTVVREAHFMERLRQVAAMCGPGGGSCRRLVAVVGRAHAARLRRALQQQHQQDEQVQQMPLRKNRGL